MIRREMGIPTNASWWTYAQKGCLCCSGKKDLFLADGGFLFLDGAKNIVGITRIGGKDLAETQHFLEFRAPMNIKVSEIPRALQDERRWFEVTLPNLLAAGAQRYAWVCPGEIEGTTRGGYLYRLADGVNYPSKYV